MLELKCALHKLADSRIVKLWVLLGAWLSGFGDGSGVGYANSISQFPKVHVMEL
jgi:hypothetical protein